MFAVRCGVEVLQRDVDAVLNPTKRKAAASLGNSNFYGGQARYSITEGV